MGERDHALWQKALLMWFWRHEGEREIEVLQEQRVQVAAARFRVPDVAVLDSKLPSEQIVTQTPLAVFEISSPEDTLQRFKQRLEDYREMGIPEIRVIDPHDSTYYRYEAGELQRNGTFSLPGKGISLELETLKALFPK